MPPSAVDAMTETRRAVLKTALLGMVAGLGSRLSSAQAQADRSSHASIPAESDLAAAERVLGLSYTDAERKQLARTYEEVLQSLDRIHKLELRNDLSRALRFDPRLPGKSYPMPVAGLRGNAPAAGPLPGSPSEVALAPAWKQAAWLRNKSLSSVELTRLYLQRIGRLGPTLENFITVTDDLALKQAAQADADLARGKLRSPLHGVPYGLKDLFDVEGVHSTWGAEPYKDQVATINAVIVDRLAAAGTVLLGKTAVGALAYGDIWHGGVSRNPWNKEEGSSGSSAGSASATAAGLVGFSIGTETLGSIVSPSNRCGTTGLRPTFGRISRRGGMSLCWSWDKVGPLARTTADCALALGILNGGDVQDWGSIDAPYGWDWQARVEELRVGFVPAWFEGEEVTEVDKRALAAVRETGATLVEVAVPDLPYDLLVALVFIEAAACFADFTLTHRDDQLKWQDDMAWPNNWRRMRLFPAVEMVQLERLRRQAMEALDRVFSQVDVLIGPSGAGNALVATNATGHPCLALKAGFVERPTRTITDAPLEPQGRQHRVPRVISLWAGLFREDRLITLGRALEAVLRVADEHPPMARS